MRRLFVLLPLLALVACQSAPAPKPAPEPVPEFTFEPNPPPPPPPPVPTQTVIVTGSAVNVRSGPATSAAIVGHVGKGERLKTTGRNGDWWELLLDGDRKGYISAKFARLDEPCLPDTVTPQILTPPAMSFDQAGAHGVVELKISVDAKGDVSAVKVVSNGTGDAALEKQAVEEVRGMKFSPLVRKCRAVPFVYMFNRTF